MQSWGFEYRQTLVWHKLDGNTGGSVAPNSAEQDDCSYIGKNGDEYIVGHDRLKNETIADTLPLAICLLAKKLFTK